MPRLENLFQQSSPYGVPPRSLFFSLINSEINDWLPQYYLARMDILLSNTLVGIRLLA